MSRKLALLIPGILVALGAIGPLYAAGGMVVAPSVNAALAVPAGSGASTLPNLKPYCPAGWPSPVVISTAPYDHSDDFPISSEDSIYVDYSIVNQSPVAVPQGGAAHITLVVDNTPVADYAIYGLPGHACIIVNDEEIGPLDPGLHTVQVVADIGGLVQESDETDNVFARTLAIDEDPNPAIEAEPKPVVLYREVLYVSGQPVRAARAVACADAAPEAAAPEDWTIRLKSRQFDPLVSGARTALMAAGSGPRNARHALIQLQHIPSKAEREDLERAGVKLLSYVPNKAWFSLVKPGVNPLSLLSAGVRAACDIEAEDKLSPALRDRGPAPWSVHNNQTATLQVRFFEDVLPYQARRIVSGLGGKLQDIACGTVKVTLPIARIADLAARDEVQWIEDDEAPNVAFNDLARDQANVNTVLGAPYGLSGAGVAIGIWDAGRVDATHGDLIGRVLYGDTYTQISDHATHVAGTMAGTGALSAARGGTPYQWKGMAPAASIVSYQWDNALSKYEIALITFGIAVSQNSWGRYIDLSNTYLFGNYDLEQAAYDSVIRGAKGRRVTVCWAAGNDRDDCYPNGQCEAPSGYGCIVPPGTAKNIITVGAINSDDDTMTVFSGWGPTDDGRLKPEIVAAGCQVNGDHGTTSSLPPQTYGSYCGTSMACPVVSGIAALIVERFRQIYGQEPLPSTVKALLAQSAVDLGPPGPDYSFGYGKVNAKGAVDIVDSGGLRENTVASSATIEYPVDVLPGTNMFKATLAWDDAPGTPNAQIELVNNLDLEVVDPWGLIHRPWVLDPDHPASAATTGTDNINPIEQVLVENPAPGAWKIRIKVAALPEPPQTYSLVCNCFGPQDTMIVRNDGISGLQVNSIVKQYGSPWLGFAPAAFDVSVNRYQPVSLEIAVNDLSPGAYTDELLIDWNRPEGSQEPDPYPVPIVLHVSRRYQENTAAALKMHPPGTAVRIVAKPVIAGTEAMCGAFYIEEDDRASGIRVLPPVATQVSAGDRVTVDGSLVEIDGELCIQATDVQVVSSNNPIPQPLAMSSINLGGRSLGYQSGIWAWRPAPDQQSGGFVPVLSEIGGPNNVGLLVRMWGRVAQKSNGGFYLQDGANTSDGGGAPVGVRAALCSGSLIGISDGDYVFVTGISSCTMGADGKPVRLLRIRTPSDVIRLP